MNERRCLVDGVAIGLVLAAGVALRFYTPSALWHDEALAVNIARLPLSEIPAALARDGHPPLFYVLLHAWIGLAGDGDRAVRALSGVFSVALLPLAWTAGRRLGGSRCAWTALLVVCLWPYAIYFANSARMYALVMLLSLAGTLLVADALSRPRLLRLAAVAVVSGLLSLTHYWGLWLLAATGAVLAIAIGHTWRTGQRAERRSATLVLASMVAGGLVFLPWYPTFSQQLAHTGTPWGAASGPLEIARRLLSSFSGGAWGPWLLGPLALVGVIASFRDSPRGMPRAGAVAAVFALTILVAGTGGWLTGTTFEGRYAAPLFPLFVLAVARGCSWFERPLILHFVVALVLAWGVVGIGRDLTTMRTTAPLAARAIRSGGARGDVVAFCPDEIGPAVSRLLPDGYDQVTYPGFDRPGLVDYRDYVRRHAQAEPRAFVTRLIARAGARDIWFVSNDRYAIAGPACRAVRDLLFEARPNGREVVRRRTAGAETTEAVDRFPGPSGSSER
jgi:mannosyltransferase